MIIRPIASRMLALTLSTVCLSFFLTARAKRQHAHQSSATASAGANQAKSLPQADVVRGRYLVEQVAMCGECHTPRDADGNLDSSRWLQGARIWIKPVHTMYNWAEWAPRLAGLPSYTDEQAEDVLEKGIGPNGVPIRPPMHIYHMNHPDAVAIIAYLRSLHGSYGAQVSQ
ncbi:MAG: hypothetical protein WBD87_09230 [Candidatus Acidiferrales bacterium]